jgi:hypothetical protein
MRRRHQVVLLILGTTAMAGMASPALAENPIYLVGKLGSTTMDTDLGNTFRQVIDGDDDSWAFGVGLRLGDHLAFQAEYQDFGSVPGVGSPCADNADACIEILVPVQADSTAISVSVLPHLPLTERLFVYGKLGFVSWESDVSDVRETGNRFIDDFKDEDLVYGAGVRLVLPGPFGAFAEYERIADLFDTVSVGATFGF